MLCNGWRVRHRRAGGCWWHGPGHHSPSLPSLAEKDGGASRELQPVVNAVLEGNGVREGDEQQQGEGL